MFEKLNKLRAESERWHKREAYVIERRKAADLKLKQAEDETILEQVGSFNLTPEKLHELLKLITGGKSEASPNAVGDPEISTAIQEELAGDDPDMENYDESEDETDEED